MSSDLTEKSRNNLYFLLENRQATREIDIILDEGKNINNRIRVMSLLMSKDAVELIKESEALAIQHYKKRADTDPEMKKRVENHRRLVDELMEVRNYVNP